MYWKSKERDASLLWIVERIKSGEHYKNEKHHTSAVQNESLSCTDVAKMSVEASVYTCNANERATSQPTK